MGEQGGSFSGLQVGYKWTMRTSVGIIWGVRGSLKEDHGDAY